MKANAAGLEGGEGMERMEQTDVLIVGAGPVGLTLAIDLGQKGVRCTLIEKKEAPEFLPKMERCNARTMEIFRRMGLSDKIRKAGLDASVPMDVYVVLAMNEPPLLRLPYPSVNEALAEIRKSEDASQPLEAYQLISQYTLEPLLKSVAEELPTVTVRYGTEFLSLEQDEGGVTARTTTKNGDVTYRAKYVIGCDGGASPVRKQLGIKLRGEGNLLHLRQALYYSEELYNRIPLGDGPGRGRHYHVADGQATFLIMQDSTKHWTLHAVVEKDEDMAAQFEKAVGAPVDYQMLYVGQWKQNLLLADNYGSGRVFLAGDAAHLVIPTGGLGMNTGVGDAVDLGWKLAATLEGWGGPNLLRSYEIERRQVGDRNVGASRYASLGRRKWRSQYRPDIRDNTPAGQATRDNLAGVADTEQRKTNEMIGAELGYRYVGSPVITDEPGGPEHLFREYHPTTWPGARLPHLWLGDNDPVQDRIGAGYTMLRLGGTQIDTSGIEGAFKARGVPYQTLDIASQRARDIYGYDLVLVRPDMHVVWRGKAAPDDAEALAAMVTGH
ncbi:FAD-dependent monooxygenase [Rhizobium sp. RAF36]|uniref:FAD-dependent monooxygenase n=1 Tax=Rhizobium sp. RAF36 TaxID=3233055 RepID=UPI003F965E4F